MVENCNTIDIVYFDHIIYIRSVVLYKNETDIYNLMLFDWLKKYYLICLNTQLSVVYFILAQIQYNDTINIYFSLLHFDL